MFGTLLIIIITYMKADILKPSRQTILREAKDYVMIAVGMILYGIGWTVFLLPNDITTGGVPGIASIVYWATGFPVQYTYFSINISKPRLLVTFRFVFSPFPNPERI